MLSPMPSITRSTSSEMNPPAKPISSVLAAQTITPERHQPVNREAIAQPAGEQLHRRVNPEEGRDRRPELGRGKPKLALHQRRRYRDRAAVDIVEEHRRAEQDHQRAG